MTGPDTGQPPPGPGRFDPAPMSWERRLAIYRRQNGCLELTPRQYRRLVKKSRHHAREATYLLALGVAR